MYQFGGYNLMPPKILARSREMTATLLPTLQSGHIGLNVSDINRSTQFYQAVFGFEIMGGSQESEREFVFLGDESRLILTLWQQSSGSFATETPGLHHLSFQVDSIEAVKQAERRLQERGAHFFHQGIVPHREGASSGGIFFADPDGIRLEIYAPAGAEENQAPSGAAPTCGFF
jgi:lactoylglutathione lyase